MNSKFQQAGGRVSFEDFQIFTKAHIALGIKYLEINDKDNAVPALSAAKQFAEQLNDQDLLKEIGKYIE